jgi:hypothetical protein
MATVTTTPTQRELERLRYEREMRQRSIATSYQQRADAVFAEWGTRAKQRVEGEDVEDYRRTLCVQAKKLLPYSDDRPSPDYTATFRDLRKLKLWSMSPQVFAAFEPQIYDACAKAYARDDTCPADGTLREVVKIDPATGFKEVRFYGRQSFVRGMNREGRRVTSFRTDHGYVDASGRPLR